jgi:hypothetical protein
MALRAFTERNAARRGVLASGKLAHDLVQQEVAGRDLC